MTAAGTSRLASSRHNIGIVERVRRIWEYRELLVSLTRRELKVKYKNSVLGFFWTLLNPLLYLVVFSVVFTGFLRNSVPQYGIFLLSGLLIWNLFSSGVVSATSSIVANGSLVQKVWFPREVLPLSAAGAALVNFMFQLVVLAVGLVATGRTPEWSMIWLLPLALFVVCVHVVALGMLLAALNVYLRDVQHFLELALLAWFWVTPIVYQFDFLGDRLVAHGWSDGLAFLNPLQGPVLSMQRVIYNPAPELQDPDTAPMFDLMLSHDASWYLLGLGLSAAMGFVSLIMSVWVFGRLEANVGEAI